MSDLTISAAGFVLQPLVNQPDGATVELRWWYNRSFLDSNGVQVQWGTGKQGFWVTTPCSLADGLINVDQDTLLWTTDDAQDPAPLSLAVSAGIFVNGKMIQQLTIASKSQWVVPSSLAPTTTWAGFSNYQQAVTLYYYNPNYYNAPTVDRLIDQAFDTHPATQTSLGTVFTSVPPAIPGAPVAWITDDPLVRDATSIEGVPVSDTPPLDSQTLVYNQSTNQWEPGNQNPGTGNVVSNEVSSVDGQVALASGTGGKTIKFSSDTGIARVDSGTLSAATQNEFTLTGRGEGFGAGDLEEITLGGNLTMTGTMLDATGSGDVTAASNLTDDAFVVGDGGVKGVKTVDSATATASLDDLVGDAGAGGTAGLAPAPAAGDAAAGKFLKADATWAAPSGTGAPSDATYITQTSNGGLSAEQALGALATGILKSTTTTGVVSIAVAGTDYVSPTATSVDATGAPLTLNVTHNGKVVLVDDDVTVPSGLGVGFNCFIVQAGASAITFVPSSTTLNSLGGLLDTGGQWAGVSVVATAADVFLLAGGLA